MLNYKLHLIRHGMTSANHQGLFLGRTDVGVCEKGMQELALLKENFVYPDVQKVYASPMLRCKQTARFLYPDTYTVYNDNLMECDFGVMEGKTSKELEGTESLRSFLCDGINYKIEGGESGMEFLTRLEKGITEVFSDMMKEKITNAACVTHGGVITLLLCALGLPSREASAWMPQNGTGYTILFTPAMWQRDHKFEVYSYLPYGKEETSFSFPAYEIIDAERSEDKHQNG